MAKPQQFESSIGSSFLPAWLGSLSTFARRLLRTADHPRNHVNAVLICPHVSQVVEGEVVWEDWTVDPQAIEEAPNGALRIRGYEDRELWTAPFSPLSREVVNLAIEQGTPLAFRCHPTASGLFLVENAA